MFFQIKKFSFEGRAQDGAWLNVETKTRGSSQRLIVGLEYDRD